jgi:hypothetical protein
LTLNLTIEGIQMKRSALIAALLALTLSACGKQEAPAAAVEAAPVAMAPAASEPAAAPAASEPVVADPAAAKE